MKEVMDTLYTILKHAMTGEREGGRENWDGRHHACYLGSWEGYIQKARRSVVPDNLSSKFNQF